MQIGLRESIILEDARVSCMGFVFLQRMYVNRSLNRLAGVPRERGIFRDVEIYIFIRRNCHRRNTCEIQSRFTNYYDERTKRS